MREFKTIFANLRKEEGLSQVEMAKKLNVACGTVAMWETGQRTPLRRKYEEISDYFNVDMDYLLGKQEEKRRLDLTTYFECGELLGIAAKDDRFIILAKQYLQLPEDKKAILLNQAEFLYHQFCQDTQQ